MALRVGLCLAGADLVAAGKCYKIAQRVPDTAIDATDFKPSLFSQVSDLADAKGELTCCFLGVNEHGGGLGRLRGCLTRRALDWHVLSSFRSFIGCTMTRGTHARPGANRPSG
jgi:hypothetical protein